MHLFHLSVVEVRFKVTGGVVRESQAVDSSKMCHNKNSYSQYLYCCCCCDAAVSVSCHTLHQSTTSISLTTYPVLLKKKMFE